MPWVGVHPFECPTRVFYGRGASSQVGERLRELGVTRALVVSDSGVAGAGIVDAVADHARAATPSTTPRMVGGRTVNPWS